MSMVMSLIVTSVSKKIKIILEVKSWLILRKSKLKKTKFKIRSNQREMEVMRLLTALVLKEKKSRAKMKAMEQTI